MRNLVLCGFQGVGKTTHGRAFAHAVDAPFYDTDELVRNSWGGARPCSEIVRDEGIAAFRAVERAVVASLKGVRGAVIALGGGTLDAEENRKGALALGCVVYLEADESVVKDKARIEYAPFESIYLKRRPLFEAVATYRMRLDENTGENLKRVWLEITSETSLRS